LPSPRAEQPSSQSPHSARNKTTRTDTFRRAAGRPIRRVTISSRVFVGNIGFETSQQDLETLFSQVGEVAEVVLPVDRATDQPRGFAFIEFKEADAVMNAIEQLDGAELGGRTLRVSEARERAARPSFGGGGGGMSDGPNDRPRKVSRPKGSRRGVRGRKRGF
jgi:RNA recognition motif-containing protein